MEKWTVSKSLRWATKSFYDIQEMRKALQNRKKKKGAKIDLSDLDLALIKSLADGMKRLEDEAQRHIETVIKGEPMYPWLSSIAGIGTLLSAVILTEFDPYKARHPSSFNRFCGLDVVGGKKVNGRLVGGHAPKRVKGKKLTYNSWLRSKMLDGGVGGCIIKTCLRVTDPDVPYIEIARGKQKGKPDPRWERWGVTNHYQRISTKKEREELEAAGEKVEKETVQLKDGPEDWYYHVVEKAFWVPTGDDGKYIRIYLRRKETKRKEGWGKSHGHRHYDAQRVMVKMFLIDLWLEWRRQLGLPLSGPYHERVLGIKHHE